MAGRNVFTVLEESAKSYGDAAALHQPFPGKGPTQYRSYSWNEWLTVSRAIALGLRALGFRNGQIACILSETRAELYLVDLGIIGAGGISGALYTANTMPDLAENIRGAQPDYLFVENAKTLALLTEALLTRGVPQPKHVICMVGAVEESSAMTLSQLQELGSEACARDKGVFERLQAEISPDDPAILYLTSGATGVQKMGLTSHAAILANLDMGPEVLPMRPDDSTIAFLPSAHVAQRIAVELVPMRMGTPVWFSESLARLPGDLRSVRPTVFLAPPRVWERMYATVMAEVKKRPLTARKLFDRALALGMMKVKYQAAGRAVPFWLSALLPVADKLVFSKIRERLGGRIRIALSGAAPLSKDLAQFFAAVGLPIVEGYGLTEAGIVCFNPLLNPKAGSVGKLLPGVEGRIATDGELVIRTACAFQGYYRDKAATDSVIDSDGWFYTGDIAEIDEQGFCFITGRKKELIVSSNGKKIYPSRIESLFKMEPLVSQVLLVGDKKPYLTAILTLNLAQLQGVDGIGKAPDASLGAQLQAEPVTKAVQQVVTRVNQQLADFERIRRFKILEREFSIEHGELTPTMKIRRAQVLENHKELVSDLYLGREEIG